MTPEEIIADTKKGAERIRKMLQERKCCEMAFEICQENQAFGRFSCSYKTVSAWRKGRANVGIWGGCEGKGGKFSLL
ncbi:MAG: hypothetical protein J6D02_09950 [Lachnospira sp.]|nr:hypothetical protein [Lachnospira sp.]